MHFSSGHFLGYIFSGGLGLTSYPRQYNTACNLPLDLYAPKLRARHGATHMLLVVCAAAAGALCALHAHLAVPSCAKNCAAACMHANQVHGCETKQQARLQRGSASRAARTLCIECALLASCSMHCWTVLSRSLLHMAATGSNCMHLCAVAGAHV
jgi:hypothetical protein